MRLPVKACALMFGTALLAHTPLSAQTTFGALLGGNAAKLAGIDVTSSDLFNGTSEIKNRIGFQAGIYLNRRFGSMWSLQPEIHYTQKGTTLDFGGTGQAAGELGFNFGYAEVPVLLRADFGGEGLHPFIVAGPSIAMRLSCNATLAGTGASLEVDCEEFDDNGTTRDPFKKTDIGGTVGVGLSGRLLGRAMSAQVRYGRGFTNILSDDASGSTDTQTPKNSVLSVVFGLGR
jgi:Outer membrane protein beta-barrel domain